MAYLNFSAIEGSPVLPGFQSRPAKDFSALEWSVIQIARTDPLGSLKRPGRFAAALARLVGRSMAQPLADPRLESLRRFAVFAWRYGYRLPVSEIARFVKAGFSADQAEDLIGHAVSSSVTPSRRAPRWSIMTRGPLESSDQ